MKSFVWYSRETFEKNGWQVPTTWDQMTALSDKIAASGTKPWCFGIESGDATRWPADRLLRGRRAARHRSDAYDDELVARATRWTTRGSRC